VADVESEDGAAAAELEVPSLALERLILSRGDRHHAMTVEPGSAVITARIPAPRGGELVIMKSLVLSPATRRTHGRITLVVRHPTIHGPVITLRDEVLDQAIAGILLGRRILRGEAP